MSKWLSTWAPVFAAVPPLAILGFCAAIWARAAWMRDATEARYRTLAAQALAADDNEQAKLCYARIIDGAGSTNPQDQLQWAFILARGGDQTSAAAVIDRLAPDNGRGLADAHRFKAIQMAQQLGELAETKATGESKDEFLLRFKHHIDRSGNANAIEIADLRAAHSASAGKPDEALKHFFESARAAPDRWLRAAAIAKTQSNQPAYTEALAEAETYHRGLLQESPQDHQARIALAAVLIESKRLADASRLLAEGLKLSDRAELRRAASDLVLLRMQQFPAPWGEDFGEFSRLLARALELDPVNPAAYQVLLEVYHRADAAEQRAALRARLERQIAQGQSIAFAHFALGTMLWSDGDHDAALWHNEQAFALNPELLDVANNLAWLISETDTPDLDRAYKLIERVVQQRPDHVNYRDTKGVILMKMKRQEEALIEFETILPRLSGAARKQVHERLATVYDALNKPSLAAIHREEAERL